MTDGADRDGIRRASTKEEIDPLVALCRAGRLFDVQAWIASGKPVNAPPRPAKGRRVKPPLHVAIETGFHSVVEVLLRAGARQEPPTGYDSPVSLALYQRRLDIIELLVEHGCDVKAMNMNEVLGCWNPAIFAFFIGHGADLITGHPFARAFCARIQTALRPFKEVAATRPELIEQANIALRHHCKEGDVKWVSLLLWAGADPLKPGCDTPDEADDAGNNEDDDDDDDKGGLSALGYAALYGHYEVFKLKAVRTRLTSAAKMDFASYLRGTDGVDVLRQLLSRGWRPNDQENGGCSVIPRMLESLNWQGRYSDPWRLTLSTGKPKRDSSECRETMRAIHLLAKHGAKWIPTDNRDVGQVRRALLQMIPDYTVELIWVMSKYLACDLATVQELIASPSMKKHVAGHRAKLSTYFAEWSGRG